MNPNAAAGVPRHVADTGSASQPNSILVRCPRCGAEHPVKTPNSRKAADAAVRWIVTWLTRNAKGPEKIGRRVQQLALALKDNRERGEMIRLAKEQEVSHARASIAVSEAEAALFEARNATEDSARDRTAHNS